MFMDVHFDIDGESRKALEFDELLEWVASYARTEPGRQRVAGLSPSADLPVLAAELDSVEELRALLAEDGKLIAGAIPDPAPAIEALKFEGMRLEPAMLRDLAENIMVVAGLRKRLARLEADDHPHLHRLGGGFPDLSPQARDIRDCIEPDGHISDDASGELRRIRNTRTRVGERLRRMLEGYLRDPDSGPVIQDDFITERNGRFVIPLRIDAPRQVRGIVHATSSSGATRFVEPLESVDLNNELVRLGEQEQEEQDRLLLAWSEMLRFHLDDILNAAEGLAVLDSLQARALFAEECRAVRPAVSEGGALALDALRHPLLERRLRDEGSGCVPLSLGLDPYDQILVLSGPNTGGKTVALKTFGLAVLMAQSGIPVPAEEVRLPLFGQLRADIGDHQSIEADLSTYSAHISAVISFLEAARSPALFLFDEIGGGTEPVEGAALAQSILESLIAPGMTTVATTHQEALKAWAFTTDGAVSAAMEFDTVSLRPTYRILMGAAGISAGLDIAARLGLDREIVERARSRLGEDKRRSVDYLNRLGRLTAEMEEKRAELALGEAELSRQRSRLAERAEHEELARRRQAEERLERALREFRAAARKELAAIRDKREKKRAERNLAKQEQRLRAEQMRQIESVTPGAAGAGPDRLGVPRELREGMEVHVRSLGRRGRVQSVRGDQVEVLLGRALFKVALSDLGVDERDEKRPQRGSGRAHAAPRLAIRDASVPAEIKLIGMRVDEALPVLDKFLDAALLAGHPEVRVIHGHGTGRLRNAVRDFLDSHVQVASHRPGGRGEGGEGATVALMAED
jgi:DNA mismatch repair protein MutS2